ncbi:MAG TPA: head-tail connector protein [Paracoccus sp. (in: a-proteobacteria)]|uniref:head-tail connector protein n=1 Tax=Paracoccus sp. TaxID=267 RepID=UPI002BE7E377|nr:head-tail connector protein [Paracoccus sp. (in: a-proteobacteria)]HWL56408.1 head-tail connector protein [Paracoccus sp. (in: a-proteobacteria)]
MEAILIDIGEVKRQLGLTMDNGDDDWMIQGKIEAAENFIDRELGFRMRTRWPPYSPNTYGGENVPAALREAVMQLAAWWYENREAVTDLSRELPFGVREIINQHREWTF